LNQEALPRIISLAGILHRQPIFQPQESRSPGSFPTGGSYADQQRLSYPDGTFPDRRPKLIAYLEKRAKSIPPDRIPALLHDLPMVLSRNIAEETSLLVIRQLNELGAEARFAPMPDDTAGDAPLPEPNEPAEGVRIKLHFTLPSLLCRTGPLTADPPKADRQKNF